MVKLRTTRKAFLKRWTNCRGRDRSLIIRSNSTMSKRNEKGFKRRRHNVNNKRSGENRLSRGMNKMQENAKVKSLKIHPPFGLSNRKLEPSRSAIR